MSASLWSPEQQVWLKALGHRVFVLAGAGPEEDALVGDPRGDAPMAMQPPAERGRQGASERGPGVASPRPDRPAPRPAAPPAETPSRGSAPVNLVTARSPRTLPSRAPEDALERALLCATGQRTRSEARSVLERLRVDIPALRGNPEAKRALWRQIRSLRPRFRT